MYVGKHVHQLLKKHARGNIQHTSKLPDLISLRNFREPATLQRSPMLTKLVNLFITIFSIPKPAKSGKLYL